MLVQLNKIMYVFIKSNILLCLLQLFFINILCFQQGIAIAKKTKSYKQLIGAKYLGSDGVVLQRNKNDCGPASLKMIFDFFKIKISLEEISTNILKRNGSNMLDIKKFAEKNGLKVFAYKMGISDLNQCYVPMILHLNQDHFVVVESVLKNNVVFLDPMIGRLSVTLNALSRIWTGKLLFFKKF